MTNFPIHPRLRRTFSRFGSLIILFQRLPIVQMLFPEAQFLGSTAVCNSVSLAITTVIGLGAYDSVAGATSIAQVTPSSGSSTVPVTGGSSLSFLFQLVGGGGHTPASWTVTGALPSGLSLTNPKATTKTNTITGTTNAAGSYPITIKAWENSNFSGNSATGAFTIVVTGGGTPAGISTQPASTTINSGSTATITVVASGTGPFTYQWYEGNSGTTTTPVGTNSDSFITPALSKNTNYWVKITNAANSSGADSNTAMVTVRSAYETWSLGGGFLPGQDDPFQTPHNDGVINLLKYAFNLDPTQPDTRSLNFGEGNTAGLPTTGVVGGRLQIEFIRRKASGNPGITYIPQCGTNLTDWNLPLSGEKVTPIGTTEWERVQINGPTGLPSSFGRVQIIQAP